MSFADHFSGHAAEYARYRPGYPADLFAYLAGLAPNPCVALDVGTGNGQAAVPLAGSVAHVVATDPSRRQLAHAVRRANIDYVRARGEDVVLRPKSVGLITVGQALHWLDREAFYRAVRNVAQPGAVIAALGYDPVRVTPEIDAIIQRFYRETLRDCWPPERRLVEERYATVTFPFAAVDPEPATFETRDTWPLAQLLGYLRTWSAVRRYVRTRDQDPVQSVETELRPAWGDPESERPVRWPLFLRVGRVE